MKRPALAPTRETFYVALIRRLQVAVNVATDETERTRRRATLDAARQAYAELKGETK